MKPNPCPYETCVNHKKNDCDSHQIEVCVKLRKEYASHRAETVIHAHWTDKGSLSCRCSHCGCKATDEFPYCPRCGARMDEETKN